MSLTKRVPANEKRKTGLRDKRPAHPAIDTTILSSRSEARPLHVRVALFIAISSSTTTNRQHTCLLFSSLRIITTKIHYLPAYLEGISFLAGSYSVTLSPHYAYARGIILHLDILNSRRIPTTTNLICIPSHQATLRISPLSMFLSKTLPRKLLKKDSSLVEVAVITT